MAENIRLEIVTPEKQVLNDEAQIVMSPGVLGEFGVLINHTPFMTTLKVGTIHYKDSSDRERFVFVSGGFAEALPDKVTILAESAERRQDIDMERAQSAMARAQSRLASSDDDSIDFARAKTALERALHRVRLAEMRLS